MSFNPGVNLIFLLAFIATAGAAVIRTVNDPPIVLPPGTSNHGDPKLLCRPAQWTDVGLFYAGNYLAHIATTRVRPGDSILGVVASLFMSLTVPAFGVERGVQLIWSRAKLAKSDLEMAAKAGALCTVIRRNEKFKGPWVSRKLNWGGSSWVQDKINGYIRLPPGFILVTLPGDATFVEDEDIKPDRVSLACSYGIIKIALAIAQVIYAVVTLYKTRGDQLDRYGYAAFGLTVAPYALMSIINLVGSMLCPDYPAQYIVKSRWMADQKPDGLEYSGAVGKLDPSYEATRITSADQGWVKASTQKWITRAGCVFLGLFPLAIVGGLSHFHKGHSTVAQRAWTMSWIACGALGSGTIFPMMGSLAGGEKVLPRRIFVFVSVGCFLLFQAYIVPAIGGFIVVGKMMHEYGVCIRLP